MVNVDRADEVELSEPDISDDDMGPGLNLETPEEIQRIELDASNASQAAGATAPAAPAVEQTPRKKKRKLYTSDVWKHFNKGPEQPDGTYDGTCKYCGKVYKQGCQRSTSSMWHHFQKGCKKVPGSKRHRPDVLQRLLQAGTENGGEIGDSLWPTDDATPGGVCASGSSSLLQ